MKKMIMLIGLFSIMGFSAMSQVKDISLNVAPTAEYTIWDNHIALNNSALLGGRLGFGFGRFFEIRGTYMKSINLKANVKDLENSLSNVLGNDWIENNSLADQLTSQSVDITRWGGELKANIGTRRIAPYIVLGSGVNIFKYDKALINANQLADDYKEKQIYISAGLGFKLNLTKRLVMTIEAKNTMFNVDGNNLYLTKKVDNDTRKTFNWSGAVSLEYYLGGRKPDKMTELDKAYLKTFTNGFKGATFSIEPTGKYIDFGKDSFAENLYFLGGYAGIDLTDFIGIRGFYFHSTGSNLSLNFDKTMQMYGGNLIAHLNYTTGIVPFISLGGGYLDVMKQNEVYNEDQNTAFVMGNIGIDVPLSKNILAYGSVGKMITTNKNEEDLTNPSDLIHHMTYDFGLRFKLGARTKSPQQIIKNKEKEDAAAQKALLEKQQSEYDAKIDSLNQQLEKAYKKENVEKTVEPVTEEKQVKATPQEKIILTGKDLEILVKEIMEEINKPQKGTKDYYNNYYKGSNNIYERIDMLERLFLQMNYMPQAPAVHFQQQVQPNNVNPQNVTQQNINQQILKNLNELNKQLEKNNQLLEQK